MFRFGYRRFIRIICLLWLVFLFASCLEVKQEISLKKDGSGISLLHVGVQNAFAPMIIPELKNDAAKRGWELSEEKEIDGQQVVSFKRGFANLSELNDDDATYTFFSEKRGMFSKAVSIRIKHKNTSDMPFSYQVTAKMPGKIAAINGKEKSQSEVQWNLQGLQRGTELSVDSSVLAFPALFESAALSRAAVIVVTAVLGALAVLGLALMARKAMKPALAKSDGDGESIFCTECGKENFSSASFCTSCGQRVE